MRLVELPEAIPGHLYVHGMPGRYEPLEEFLDDVTRNKINCVVCLVSPDEIRKQSPAYARLLAAGVRWEHIAFPILHSGKPIEPSLKSLPNEIVRRLQRRRNVLIHCDSGLGRAGTVAVAVLLNIWPQIHNPATAFERRALPQDGGAR